MQILISTNVLITHVESTYKLVYFVHVLKYMLCTCTWFLPPGLHFNAGIEGMQLLELPGPTRFPPWAPLVVTIIPIYTDGTVKPLTALNRD